MRASFEPNLLTPRAALRLLTAVQDIQTRTQLQALR
jgi:hypothetical protein